MDSILHPPPGFHNGPIKDECYEPPSNVSRQASNKAKYSLPVEDHALYAAVVLDDDGKIFYRTSQCLKSEKEELLKHVADRLGVVWTNKIQQRKNSGHYPRDSTQKGSKRSGSPTFTNSPIAQASSPIPCSSLPLQKRRRFGDRQARTDLGVVHSPGSKRHVVTSQSEGSSVTPARIGKPCPSGFSSPPMRQIEVQETDAIAAWMHEAFAAVQQQACRLLAKEWIKIIQPKKQSTNPYNGKRAGMENPSPELTKPIYWPPNVEHKEPDHLKSPGRTALLTHLMMNTPQKEIRAGSGEGVNSAKELYAKDLLSVLDWDKSNDLKNKRDIIENIVNVRSIVESYNEGGIDGTTVFSVPCYKEKPRKKLDNNKQVVDLEEKPTGQVAQIQPKACEVVNLADTTWDQMTNLSASEGGTPFDSSETPPASDDQDQTALLNMSFTSTATGLSSALSCSSPPSTLRLRQASQTTLNCHPNNASQTRRGTMVLDNTDMQSNGPNYSQHPHVLQGHPGWPPGLALAAGSFPADDLMTLLQSPSGYNTGLMDHHASSLLGTVPSAELQDSPNYNTYYVTAAGRMVPYRVVHELSDPMQTTPQNFSAPVAYYNPQYQQQPQHLRH